MVWQKLGKLPCAMLLLFFSHAQNSYSADCKRDVAGAKLLFGDDVGTGKHKPSTLPPSFSFEATPEFDDGDIGQDTILFNGRPRRLNDILNLQPRRRGGIMTVTNASLATAHSIVHACSTLYIPGGCKYTQVDNVKSARKAMAGSRPTIRLPRAALIAQFWGEAVFHWFVEDIPRLAIVSANLTSDTKILMYSGKIPKSVWAALLPLLGIDPSQVVGYSPRTTYVVDELLVPTSSRCGTVIIPAARWVNARYAAASLRLYPKPVRPYILVQQRGAKKSRRITNHDQMVAVLERVFPTHDVQVFGNNITLARAMELHCHTSLIVAPHGAGLSNMLFVCDTTRVGMVEIHPGKGNHAGGKANMCYAALARSIGVWYSALLGTGIFATPVAAPIGDVVKECTRFLNEPIKLCMGCARAHTNATHLLPCHAYTP